MIKRSWFLERKVKSTVDFFDGLFPLSPILTISRRAVTVFPLNKNHLGFVNPRWFFYTFEEDLCILFKL